MAALVLVFGGCKGESPTAPSGGGNPPGGSVTPPTNATITIAVSNPTPVVNSSSVITATVTQNGAAVPNGTAVEFLTNLGTFTDSNAPSTIRTTTNGVASATITSGAAGKATVSVTVNNVSKTAEISFQAQPVTPPPPDTAAAITGIAPTTGRPQGGEVVTITGKNFKGNVRVIFDFGAGVTKEATVISSSPTQIQVLTPAVDLGTGQTKNATIIVISDAGSSAEQRVVATSPFTFQAEVLTPSITFVSPNSGPIDGGTIVTIFGDAFQAPVQVLFGSAQAQVLNVSFKEIKAVAPEGRSTSPDGSLSVTGFVPVRVINMNSAKDATLDNAFRYVPKMRITAAGPTQGSVNGGTRVTIDGVGFNDPVTVEIGGVAAQPIKVSGTQIIAMTSPLLLTSCAGSSGPIRVTNVDNGDSADGPVFSYLLAPPTIIGISPSSVTAGGTVNVLVVNPLLGPTRFTIADKTLFPTNTVFNSDNTATYTLTLPTSFTFATAPCTTAGGGPGTAPQPLTVSVTYTNVQSNCTNTANNALVINPTDTTCTSPPTAVVSPSGAAPNCANVGAVPSAGTTTGSATITITNTGTQTLNVGAPTASVTNATTATVSPSTAQAIAAGASVTYTLTVDPAAAGPIGGSVTFSSNDPAKPTISVCVSGSGT
jgi:hypothetical protein